MIWFSLWRIILGAGESGYLNAKSENMEPSEGLLLRVLVRKKGVLNVGDFSRFRTKWMGLGHFWNKGFVNLTELWRSNVLLLKLLIDYFFIFRKFISTTNYLNVFPLFFPLNQLTTKHVIHCRNLCFPGPFSIQKSSFWQNKIQAHSCYLINICHINDCINKIWQTCCKAVGSRRYLNEWNIDWKSLLLQVEISWQSLRLGMGIL